MEQATIALVVLGTLIVKGAAILALAYAGARLAIRHERSRLMSDARPTILSTAPSK